MFGPSKSGKMKLMCGQMIEAREPDKNILAFSHRQRRKSVLAMLAHKTRQDRRASVCPCRLDSPLKEFNKIGVHRRIEIVNGRQHQSIWNCAGSDRWTL